MYKSLQVSLIPVERRGEAFFTDPLWAVDLNASIEQRGGMHLICPVREPTDSGLTKIDPRAGITSIEDLEDGKLRQLLEHSDILEIPGNFGWTTSSVSRRALRYSKKYGKVSVLGISSNRAKTSIMNAARSSILAQVKARLRALDIRLTQIFLARNCSGVRVVGKGLVSLVEGHATSLLVETASWVSKKNFEIERPREHEPPRVSLISRLEPMKGVDIGVRAAAKMLRGGEKIELRIAGDGPDRHRLEALVGDLEISESVHFLGWLSYPNDYFSLMRDTDVVALTNLNDEQPRLIFDAISRGAIPICPNTNAYSGIGLAPELLYKQGDVDSLHDALQKAISMSADAKQDLRDSLASMADSYTIEEMHLRRDEWYKSLLKRT
ncbi:glycosyltransferase [Tropicimonas sp. IMCC6043]|uniref:glycosyltransferase n=1 Tax=Tropicimonas sp. IMCC6043 TaxID=2510645 RepID=UPI00101DB38F|nr:glycosyltransferase [Tropicimonas sp. IMCC6043]RYH06238.1 glycosyltransferase family 1 protein [Tropicimonas sp. IMCC6043]